MLVASLLLTASLWPAVLWAADDPAVGFATPPDSAKPWCYWWWLNGAASKEGITRESLHGFIRTLAIPEAEKERLLALTPATYTGKASELAKRTTLFADEPVTP